MADLRTVVRKPLITEKATVLREKNNQFVFDVEKQANRIEIKQAVEKKYNVHVVSVKTVTVHGSRRRSIGRRVNKRKSPDWKKAIVTLKEGESIEVFEGV